MTLNYHTQFLQPNKVVENISITLLPHEISCEVGETPYGNDAKMDFMTEVESLMNRAPDEHTRMKIERMLNDLR